MIPILLNRNLINRSVNAFRFASSNSLVIGAMDDLESSILNNAKQISNSRTKTILRSLNIYPDGNSSFIFTSGKPTMLSTKLSNELKKVHSKHKFLPHRKRLILSGLLKHFEYPNELNDLLKSFISEFDKLDTVQIVCLSSILHDVRGNDCFAIAKDNVDILSDLVKNKFTSNMSEFQLLGLVPLVVLTKNLLPLYDKNDPALMTINRVLTANTIDFFHELNGQTVLLLFDIDEKMPLPFSILKRVIKTIRKKYKRFHFEPNPIYLKHITDQLRTFHNFFNGHLKMNDNEGWSRLVNNLSVFEINDFCEKFFKSEDKYWLFEDEIIKQIFDELSRFDTYIKAEQIDPQFLVQYKADVINYLTLLGEHPKKEYEKFLQSSPLDKEKLIDYMSLITPVEDDKLSIYNENLLNSHFNDPERLILNEKRLINRDHLIPSIIGHLPRSDWQFYYRSILNESTTLASFSQSGDTNIFRQHVYLKYDLVDSFITDVHARIDKVIPLEMIPFGTLCLKDEQFYADVILKIESKVEPGKFRYGLCFIVTHRDMKIDKPVLSYLKFYSDKLREKGLNIPIFVYYENKHLLKNKSQILKDTFLESVGRTFQNHSQLFAEDEGHIKNLDEIIAT